MSARFQVPCADGEYIKSLGPSSRNLALTLRPKGLQYIYRYYIYIYILCLKSAIPPLPPPQYIYIVGVSEGTEGTTVNNI